MESFLAVVFILAAIFGVALAYKKRVVIAKWLEDPSMAMSADLKMKRKQLTRRIEDAQFELEKLDEIELEKQK